MQLQQLLLIGDGPEGASGFEKVQLDARIRGVPGSKWAVLMVGDIPHAGLILPADAGAPQLLSDGTRAPRQSCLRAAAHAAPLMTRP